MKVFPILDKSYYNEGMDLRDYFAASAMPIIMQNWYDLGDIPGDESNGFAIAKFAYKMADLMMEARNEPV
jgi:hypothetical protein